MVAKELHAVSFRKSKAWIKVKNPNAPAAHQSSRWNLLMEVPHPSPEPSRLQHTITFRAFGVRLMLFYLS